ncbi:MAG: LacI family DNA-binding transcriptional regulator [Eubacteriales bacterium]|nr:LacI family DNA-binding transcriptional regulator [Eubacteriales bacterium]
MATLREIAERAGVSRGTVDRVLNNRGRVAAEKEVLVRKIAEELGYRPNRAAKGLALRKKQRRIGFVCIRDPYCPYYDKVRSSAEAYAKELEVFGVTVHPVYYTLAELQEEKALCRRILSMDMDGWVLDGFTSAFLPEAFRKEEREIPPFASFNMNHPDRKRVAYVGCDYEQAGRLACGLAALLTEEQGEIGVLFYGSHSLQSVNQRMEGFRAEMAERYPEMQIAFQMSCPYDAANDPSAEKIVQAIEEKPNLKLLYLVNPGNYRICRWLQERMPERKLRLITNDLVAGEQYDMIKDGVIAATICQDPEAQGREPLQLLFEYLTYGNAPEKDWIRTELSIKMRQNC